MNRHTFERQMGRIEQRHGHFTKATGDIMAKIVRKARARYVVANGKVTGYRLPDGTMVCRKRRYRDSMAAEVHLAQITHVSSRAHIPVRAYQCTNCCGWHLTSSA